MRHLHSAPICRAGVHVRSLSLAFCAVTSEEEMELAGEYEGRGQRRRNRETGEGGERTKKEGKGG